MGPGCFALRVTLGPFCSRNLKEQAQRCVSKGDRLFYESKTPPSATLGDCVGCLQDKITVYWHLIHPVILLDGEVADLV